MRTDLTVGTSATAEVPATSANLGPGFDSLGLALGWADTTKLEVIDAGYEFEISGEGSETVPKTEKHLVMATALEGLATLSARAPGLRLSAHNTIPHGRGLGSSSAALVAGLLLAWGLARPGQAPDRGWLLREAYKREGHADNVAPAILGGFVVTWSETPEDAADAYVRARKSAVHQDVRALALVPSFELPTSQARRVLPTSVPFGSAVFNASRTALLVHAFASEPELFFPATADRLHQDQRADLMPKSASLFRGLRREGFAAIVSGAGPTVLVLGTESDLRQAAAFAQTLDTEGAYDQHLLAIGTGARLLS